MASRAVAASLSGAIRAQPVLRARGNTRRSARHAVRPASARGEPARNPRASPPPISPRSSEHRTANARFRRLAQFLRHASRSPSKKKIVGGGRHGTRRPRTPRRAARRPRPLTRVSPYPYLQNASRTREPTRAAAPGDDWHLARRRIRRRTRRVRSAVQAPDARRSAPRGGGGGGGAGARRERCARRARRTTTCFPFTSTARRTTPWAGRWRGACAGPTRRTRKTGRPRTPVHLGVWRRHGSEALSAGSARRRTCPWTSSWRSPRRTTRRGTARCWRRRWAACRWWSRRGRRT